MDERVTNQIPWEKLTSPSGNDFVTREEYNKLLYSFNARTGWGRVITDIGVMFNIVLIYVLLAGLWWIILH